MGGSQKNPFKKSVAVSCGQEEQGLNNQRQDIRLA